MSSPVAPARTAPSRLASLDQFRGYTVAGMCLVNFLAPFVAVHAILKHNDTYFSYADTIMPSFLFVVGFAFRLTYLKHRAKFGRLATGWTYVRRSGKLLLLSLLIYVFVGDVPRWFEYRDMPPEFQAIAEGRGVRDEGRREIQGTHDVPEPVSLTTRPSPLIPGPSSLAPRLAKAENDANARLRAWRALGGPQRLLVHWQILAAKLIKSELWETLAIIGATQLVILPWIGCRFWTRFAVMASLGLAHGLLSYWFNWDFLYGVPGNWMSKAWMTGDDRGWDGGIFGPLIWGVVMLGGTLAYDLAVSAASRPAAVKRLTLWGLAFLAVGYSMSCVTRLYDLSEPERSALRQRHLRQDAEKTGLDDRIRQEREHLNMLKRGARASERSADDDQKTMEQSEGALIALEDVRRGYPDLSLAPSPVWPPWERLKDRSWRDLLAEPPFVAPPADDPRIDPPPRIEHRLRNYWMLGKRMPNLSFMTFATGFQFALFALFVAACDIGRLRVGLFRTLGTNPLAAYFIHGGMGLALALLVPHDASLAICLAGFAIAFGTTYLLVLVLEKRGLYWRL